jgi:cytoskeleton protein RodZ
MSLTLGEKLRQAREDRGITLSEVAEQTRISSLYLESIEHDDYRNLPGGIFNKGFVKSYAKYVGIDEQEALMDYSLILASNETDASDHLKVYKPEVLTDDGSYSMVPTIIIAVVILALMTGGILFLVNYLRQPSEPLAAVNKAANANASTAQQQNPASPTASDGPDMATVKIEFKALSVPVSLTATSDGKMSSNVITPGSTTMFEPKESLKLSYSRSLAQMVQLTINGKTISLPSVPLNPKRAAIEFEINKENLAPIWTSGAITADVPPATVDANANMAMAVDGGGAPTGIAPAPVRPTPAPKPTATPNSAVNTGAKPPANAKLPETTKPPTMTGKPPTMTGKPPGNHE